jgi:hypothetical protein
MILAYLNNPREESFSLKFLAEKYCGMPPDDQTVMNEWIRANVPQARKGHEGAYIAFAPGALVGRYAASDVEMTYRLFHELKSVLEK